MERFWIAYEPGNAAAERSIKKAGIRVVSEMVFSGGRVSGLTLFDASEYALASITFFGLPAVTGP
jgi:hypothetical protein